MDKNKADYAILLAGGNSSRMNTDKSLLEIADSTLLSYQKEKLSTLVENIVVSRNDDLPNHIRDTLLNYGPIAGIHACLGHIKSLVGIDITDAIVMPVDMPLITNELVHQLVKYGKTHNKSCFFSNHFLPVYVPDVAYALDILDDMITDDQHLVQTFVDTLGAEGISCEDDTKLANANTPMQWKIMKKMLSA